MTIKKNGKCFPLKSNIIITYIAFHIIRVVSPLFHSLDLQYDTQRKRTRFCKTLYNGHCMTPDRFVFQFSPILKYIKIISWNKGRVGNQINLPQLVRDAIGIVREHTHMNYLLHNR